MERRVAAKERRCKKIGENKKDKEGLKNESQGSKKGKTVRKK